MEIVQKTSFQTTNDETKTHDGTIILGYLALAVLMGVVFGSMSSGAAPGDFAAMTIFP